MKTLVIDFLVSFPLSSLEWYAVLFCGLCVGLSKTGINTIGLPAVPVLAVVFGAQPSTGILLPMLCFADLFAVIYYRRNAEWKYIIRLLPWALTGFALAILTVQWIPAKSFKTLIGACILVGLGVMLWNESRSKDAELPTAWWFTAIFGVMGGFSAMIGNAAGAIMAVFLLSMRLPKKSFVGTTAWFFLIINLLKLPLQCFVWHNISGETLLFSLSLLPVIAAGAFLGIVFVKKISEKNYRSVVYALTFVSTMLLFV